jgi:CheY-like chemotaxis protein
LAATTADEPAAAEISFLRGWAAGGGVGVAAVAALAFALGGESGLLDFINHGVREACHKARTTIAEALPARNQKIPRSRRNLLAKNSRCRLNASCPVKKTMSQSNAAPLSAEGGSQSLVFVVDDSAMLVEFAAMVLESAGYAVKQFTEPGNLLKALGESARRPALLVTDYDMGPHAMNGLDLIVHCHEIHPSMKAILASGTVDGSVTLHHPARVDRFLSKPYPPAQLKAMVADLLK